MDYVRKTIHVWMSGFFQLVTDAIEAAHLMSEVVAEAAVKVRDGFVKTAKLVFAISNPILYGIVRLAVGATQTPVTVDMTRLQSAVDAMKRLADRTETIDRRLDTLYSTMTIDNIEQGENIFTSLANLYNLARADISVDNGHKIRKKANAISETFLEYKETDQWLKNLIGAW